MTQLSGHKDTDFLILQQLNDFELGKVCSVNKYVNSLCDDPHFWMKRIAMTFNSKTGNLSGIEISRMREYLGFDSFKKLYKYLKTFPRRTNESIIDEKYVIELFKDEKMIDNVINENLKLNVPKWINRQELVYQIRRDFPILMHHVKNDKSRGGKNIFGNKLLFHIPNLTDVRLVNHQYVPYGKSKDYKEFNL